MSNIKSYKIKDGFYVNEVPVEMPEVAEITVPQHQFIIIDRSGSMYYELNKVCDTIINYVDKLVEGSTVSIGWFSSKGEYGLSVPYTLKKEKDGVTKTVNSYRYTLGCTCFTEVLHKVKENAKSTGNSLFFFTDGCHNEGPFSEVIKELEALKSELNIAMFVGCGYIDRDNMTEMATTVDGSFVHLSKFSEFEQSLFDFGEGVTESVPGCIVDVTDEQKNICSIVGKQVINYSVKDSKIAYKASNKKNQIYYCTSEKPLGEETDAGKNELPFRTMAFYLVQHNQTPMALDILNFLGEKYLINKLYNCFTNDEYSKVEQMIRSSIFYSKSRYKEGHVKDYLPADDAFCVLDVLETLTKDDKAVIDLTDEEFEYNKISRASEQTDGSKMIYPKEITASANKLVYNEEALNVSLQCNYSAEVPLNASEFTQSGVQEMLKNFLEAIPATRKVNCIRNYSIIADAKLNTPKLVVKNISKNTVNKLGEVITLRDDGKYVIDMSNIPLINKSYLKETSAKDLAENCWKSKELGTELSVIRYLLKQASTDKKKDYQKTEFDEILEKGFYIKNGMYQPPRKAVEVTDFYMHYEFRVNFKGYSDVSASSVIKKINEGKLLTAREIPVQIVYDKFKDMSVEDLNKFYDSKIIEYRELNNKIQHAKFAIILINRGSMPEFSSREDMTLDIIVKIGDSSETITTKFEVVKKPVKI